jgi:hypothetical protein
MMPVRVSLNLVKKVANGTIVPSAASLRALIQCMGLYLHEEGVDYLSPVARYYPYTIPSPSAQCGCSL